MTGEAVLEFDVIVMEILLIAICVCLGSLALGSWLFAPWLPTRGRDLERIGKVLALTPTDVVYDLGGGDGRGGFYLAKQFKVRAYGVEVGIPLILWCWVRKWLTRASGTTFLWKNFFKVDVSDATVVYLFGLPRTLNEKMEAKLRRELKPGARVVSYTFSFKGLTPERVDKPNEDEVSIYVYRF